LVLSDLHERTPKMTDFYLEAAPRSAKLWLNRRLPLEPTGEVAVARKQLVAAIRRLDVPDDTLFHASYHSLDEAFFDLENVLFYNVGPGSFASVARNGLEFGRIRQAPPPAPSGERFAHYHEYTFVERVAIGPMDRESSFVFPLPILSSSTKTHEVWWHAASALPMNIPPVEGLFRLRVDVGVPYRITNVAAVLKSLLDGIVSALHYDPQPPASTLQRLSSRTNWVAPEIRRRLTNPPNPVLGSRRVVGNHRDFVKWDPADDRCESCVLTITPREEPVCRVTIHNVHGTAPPGGGRSVVAHAVDGEPETLPLI